MMVEVILTIMIPEMPFGIRNTTTTICIIKRSMNPKQILPIFILA